VKLPPHLTRWSIKEYQLFPPGTESYDCTLQFYGARTGFMLRRFAGCAHSDGGLFL
jgi:hypothetical protein